MSKRRATRFVLFGGVAMAMTVAALVGGGCGSSNSTPQSTGTGTGTGTGTSGTGTGTGTATGSSSTGTGTGTGTATNTSTSSSTSSSSSSAAACNTALELLGDAGGTLVFSFDDGGITQSLGATGTWSPSVTDPADAGFTVGAEGNATIGDTCPGSLELTIPLTNLGQAAQIGFSYPSPPGIPITATAMHVAFKLVIVNPADAGAALSELVGGNDAEAFSYLNAYAMWSYPNAADGGAPDASYQKNKYAGPANGLGGFPSDGGWALATVPILEQDGAAVTSPTTIYLNQVGIQVAGPQPLDGAPAPLAFPLNVQLFVDDIYFQ